MLNGSNDKQKITSPEAIAFGHSHPENGQKDPVNPVDPVKKKLFKIESIPYFFRKTPMP